MKRIPFLILVVMLLALPATAANIKMEVSGRVNWDEWSTPVKIEDYFTVCINGEWTGRVTLQRSTDGGFNWHTFRTFDEFFCQDIESRGWSLWRIGVRAGDLEDGEVEISLTK